jgi:hypothetical protein
MPRKRAVGASRRRVVLVTAPFREAFARLVEHYRSLQPLFPDSGSRPAAFNEDLFARIVPALEQNPDIGRPNALRKLGSEAEAVLLDELAPLLAASSAVAREWVEREFTILYVVTPDEVFLVNLKHHRQLGY